MTNFEKIRQMSVEELASFMDDIGAESPPGLCDECEQNVQEDCDCPYIDNKETWKIWLHRDERVPGSGGRRRNEIQKETSNC